MKIDLFKLMDGYKGSEVLDPLRRALREDHLVLEVVVDYAQRRRERKVDNNKIAELLLAAAGHIWTRWSFIYSRCREPVNIFESPPFRRQSQRFLNLTANFVTELLEEEPGADGEPHVPAERLQLVEMLTAAFVKRTSAPNGSHEHYRHPDAARWLRLHAQYNRRVAKGLIQSARNEERVAKFRTTLVRLPVKISAKSESQSSTWEKVDWLGFKLVSTCEDTGWQEMYLPTGWYLEEDSDSGITRIFDSEFNVRAQFSAGTDEHQAELLFKPRFQVAELQDGDKVTFQVLDRLLRKSIFTSESVDRSDHDAVAEARVNAKKEADLSNSYRHSYSRWTDTFHK